MSAPHHLDGTPEEFPEREQAMAEYRVAWLEFLRGQSQPFLSSVPRLMPTHELMARMDACQTRICRGPGPVWREFTRSLPGYLEWWEGAYEDAWEAYQGVFSKGDA